MNSSLTIVSDVIDAGEMYDGFQVYRRNADSPGGLAMPGTYDVLFCKNIVTNIASLAGRQAVVCLGSGQILLQKIEIAEKPGAYDLHDIFGDQLSVTRNVRPVWGARLVMGAVGDQWDLMLASGNVANISGSLH